MEKKSTYEELEQRVKELEKAVNDRTSSEKELKLLSLAVDQSSEGIAIIDLDGNLEYINHAFAEMHGYSAEELVGRHLSIFHTPEQMPSVEAAALEIKQKGSFKGNIWHVKRDGTVFPTMMHNSLIRDEANKPIGMLGTLRDITEIRKVEESLRYSKKRYQALSDATFGSVFISEKGILTDVNQRATEMFGYRYDEFIGMTARDLTAPEYIELVEHNILSGYEEPYEAVFRKKDGSIFHAEVHGKMTRYKDKKVRVAVIHDIDDRKRAEEILHKAHDELEDKIKERTAELEKSKRKLTQEIEGHKKTETILQKRERDLESRTKDLEELNAALRVLLDKREEDKVELQDNILSNVKALIQPYVDKLKQTNLPNSQKTLINILDTNLNEIVSPFSRKLSSKLLNLSPTEIQVANLVKHGKTNKEIAAISHVSQRTIAFHRENIRKKLGIKNKKTNLKTYLMSLE